MLPLALRLVCSLAVVVGLLLLIARFSAKRFTTSSDALVNVVHRQALTRSSSLSVVTVGSKVLVLGSTEHQVTLLTELDPEELVSQELLDEALAEDPAGAGTSRPLASRPLASGPLAGSVLSGDTWKQAWATVTQAARNTTDRKSS